MLNFIEVFDVMEEDPESGEVLWTGVTGTRTALQRDGFRIDPDVTTLCPADWLDARGCLDVELVRQHPRPWSI